MGGGWGWEGGWRGGLEGGSLQALVVLDYKLIKDRRTVADV